MKVEPWRLTGAVLGRGYVFFKVVDIPGPDFSENHRVMMLGIMAAMVQKDRYVRIGRGMYKAGIAGDIAPRAVLASLVRWPMMLCVMAVMVQNDSCSGMFKAGISGETADAVPRRSSTILSCCRDSSPWSRLVGRP